MSGAGTAKRTKFRWCWVCTRQFQGNFHRIIVDQDGYEHAVHVSCVGDFEVKPGAHLKDGR